MILTIRLAAFFVLAVIGLQATAQRVLRFEKPAERFTESCPLGNGRLGAMVFGGVRDERLALNESGMWSGSPQDADRKGASQSLPEIRRLLLEGKNYEAESLVNRSFTCIGAGSGQGRGKSVPYGCYQTLGDLRLSVRVGDSPASDYTRELDLANGRATIGYTVGGVRYTREAFVSKPDEVIVLRLSANAPEAISFDVWLERSERAQVTAHGDRTLELHGQLEDGRGGGDGVRYASRLRIINLGGSVSVEGGKLRVRKADEAILLVSAATDIDSFAGRATEDARAAAERDMRQASTRSFGQLASRQAEDHGRLYDRVALHLGKPSPKSLSERLDSDPGADLVPTLFDFGRYLLVSSSRPGGFPANLQGIWAVETQTPWNGDWHANVNVQMNYWPAEPCGYNDLHQPLFALVESLVAPGSRTALQYYDARGWVAHLLLNPWGFTSPGESASWGATPTCSAWMCQHLWDHYVYTGDRRHLAAVYPILRGAAAFYADMLIEEPAHGWLVTAPSNSPENAFIDAQGRETHLCLGPAMDQQLLRYLFGAVITSAELLGEVDPLVEELREKRQRLAPTQIGSDGRVMEWLNERTEADPTHRHVSHLWGLYPGSEIDRYAHPDLAAASRASLEARGDGGTGWAIAYKACLWARLGDGDRALSLLQRLLRPVGSVGSTGERWEGGVYPNLFVAHPPFQIDGNFGATAAVAEMLLQSRYDEPDGESAPEIDLLPALPSEWHQGEVRGLHARGGVEVAMSWAENRLVSATLIGRWAPSARVRYRDSLKTIELPPGESVTITFP